MDKLSKSYISKVKAMFPIMGKKEKRYIKKLKLNIDDFLEDSTESSMEILYKEFGRSEEVIQDYYDNTNTEEIIKRIKISKYRKRFLAVLTVCILFTTIVFCGLLYSEHQAFMKQGIIFDEDIIIK